MDVGLALPQFDYSVSGESPLRWDTLAGWASRAEALGFGSVWLADHLFLSLERYGGEVSPSGCYDPLVALGGLARVTSRVRLGTLVLCTQLRPPAVLAKALATVDALSGGRLVVGMGAGWYEREFLVAGVPFERPSVRLEQLAEAVEVVRGVLAGGPFRFEGRHYRVDLDGTPPGAGRRSPPVCVGGKGDRLLELCARHADGWNTVWTWTPDEYRSRLAVLVAACERAGRDPATVARSVGLYALVGEDARDLQRRYRRLRELAPRGVLQTVSLDAWRRGHLVGTVGEVREQLAAWAETGVGELIVTAGPLPFAVTSTDDVELLASACSLEAS